MNQPEHEEGLKIPDYSEVFKEANSPESTDRMADSHARTVGEAAENWAVGGAEHTSATLGQEALESQAPQIPDTPEAPAA